LPNTTHTSPWNRTATVGRLTPRISAGSHWVNHRVWCRLPHSHANFTEKTTRQKTKASEEHLQQLLVCATQARPGTGTSSGTLSQFSSLSHVYQIVRARLLGKCSLMGASSGSTLPMLCLHMQVDFRGGNVGRKSISILCRVWCPPSHLLKSAITLMYRQPLGHFVELASATSAPLTHTTPCQADTSLPKACSGAEHLMGGNSARADSAARL
jgi:hypothetical protein